MVDIEYKIEKEFGILSVSPKGWNKELNLISWNGNEAKYDIRDWSPGHEKMGRGIALSKNEIDNLGKLIKDIML
jgi:hypothetical protein